MRIQPFMALALLLVLAAPAASRATSIVYSDRAAWEAALTRPIYTETFDTVPEQANDPVSGGTIETPLFDVISSPRVHGSASIHDGYLGSDLHRDPWLEFDLFVFDTPVMAFGADFLAIEEASGLRLTIGDETFVHRPLLDGDGYPISGVTFFGVISDGSFSSLRIESPSSPPRFYRIDNVSLVPIPEPGAWVLVAVGLSIVSRAARRERSDGSG